MKKLSSVFDISLLLFVGFVSLNAQQIPIFNQSQFDARLNNPAAFGSSGGGGVTIGYRRQFLGLDNAADAPITYFGQVDLSSPLHLDSKKIGLGLTLSQDKIHITTRLNGSLNFAYHLVKTGKVDFSAGIIAGMTSQNLDVIGRRIGDIGDESLYETSGKSAIFDGGPGLFLKFMPDEKQGLQVSIAAPGLFTSDFKYTSLKSKELIFNNVGHVLGSVSYRFSAGEAIQIEPSFRMRTTLSDPCKAGKYDLALRVLFLDSRFWVGGGARLTDAPGSFHGGFGVKPLPNLAISADYENHAQLGGSFEVGIQYLFSEKKDAQISYRALNEKLKSILNLVTGINQNLLASRAGISNSQKSARTQVSETPIKASQETLIYKSKRAREHLESARKGLVDMAIALKNAEQQQKDARDAIRTTVPAGKNPPSDVQKKLTQIDAQVNQARGIVNGLQAEYGKLDKEVKDLEMRATETADFGATLKQGDFAKAQNILQKEIDTLRTKPADLDPVSVKGEGQSVAVLLRYPNGEEKYNVQTDFRDVKGLTIYLSGKVKEWQLKGQVVESITLRADLGVSASGLKDKTAATYDGTAFGKQIKTDYVFFDRESAKPTVGMPRSLDQPKGPLTFEKLVVLKLVGLKKAMEQAGVGNIPVRLEVSSGNFSQEFTQVYSISINLKKQ